VSPETIERALMSHPAVADCLVFGAPVDDAQRSEIIVACVVAGPGGDEIQLRQYLLERLPAWQVPREWWWVDSLGTNSRGKLSRAEWRRRFLEQGAEREEVP